MNLVEFFSRETILNFRGNQSTALISISCPGDPAPLQDGWGPILRLEFSDLDKQEQVDWYRKNTPTKVALFSREQAQAIIDFIDALPQTVTQVFVHCDAGVSRSAAVARFVSQKLDCPLVGNDRLANAHVLATLHQVNKSWARMFGGEIER